MFFDFPAYASSYPTTPIHAAYVPSYDSSYAAHTGLGCSPFARRYFGNIQLFSFPLGTEMFHFPRFAPTSVGTQSSNRVSFLIRRFPDQRLLHASPELFAATPRPSSLLTAKASTICSWVLLGTQKTICPTLAKVPNVTATFI